MLGTLWVWAWLVVGLRLLSSGGAWHFGWGAAIMVAVLLLPTFGLGFRSLRRLAFSSPDDRNAEAAEALVGMPIVFVSIAFSSLALGFLGFMDGFGGQSQRGGFVNVLFSTLALHALVWIGAGGTMWAIAAWRNRED